MNHYCSSLLRPLAGVAIGALVLGCASAPLHAQQEIEEVIVTATKRAEDLQDIPINVQAISGDELLLTSIELVRDEGATTDNARTH